MCHIDDLLLTRPNNLEADVDAEMTPPSSWLYRLDDIRAGSWRVTSMIC